MKNKAIRSLLALLHFGPFMPNCNWRKEMTHLSVYFTVILNPDCLDCLWGMVCEDIRTINRRHRLRKVS